MIRRCVLVSCCVLAFAGSAQLAGAQSADPSRVQTHEPPAFKPTAATRSAEPAPVRSSDGIGTGTLLGLVLAAGAVGGLAARAATRRTRARRPAALPTDSAPALAAAPGAASAQAPAAPPAANPPQQAGPQPAPPAPPAPLQAIGPQPTPPAAPQATGPPPAAPARLPARRPGPPPRDPQPAPRPAPSADQAETCTIRLQSRGERGRFVATGEDGSVVARSPIFRRDEPATGVEFAPPEALDELIGTLAADGWRMSAKGKRPWDIRMRRPAGAPQP